MARRAWVMSVCVLPISQHSRRVQSAERSNTTQAARLFSALLMGEDRTLRIACKVPDTSTALPAEPNPFTSSFSTPNSRYSTVGNTDTLPDETPEILLTARITNKTQKLKLSNSLWEQNNIYNKWHFKHKYFTQQMYWSVYLFWLFARCCCFAHKGSWTDLSMLMQHETNYSLMLYWLHHHLAVTIPGCSSTNFESFHSTSFNLQRFKAGNISTCAWQWVLSGSSGLVLSKMLLLADSLTLWCADERQLWENPQSWSDEPAVIVTEGPRQASLSSWTASQLRTELW